MSVSSGSTRALGAWGSTQHRPRQGFTALREALESLSRPVFVVEDGGRIAVATGGRAQLGTTARGEALPLLAHVPPLLPENLGDAAFRAAHGVRFAYVAGEMANGIASEEMVEAVAREGMLGFFGAAGLAPQRVEAAVDRLQKSLGALPWGINLIHSPDDAALENRLVSLYLAKGVRLVSASAYLDLTLAVVRYRLTGIHRDASGKVVVPNRVMAKVSRVEVARRFLSPAPEKLVAQLVASGELTAEQAALAATVPMADDVTAEADSGGHTDNRPLVLLLPAIQALRDELAAKHGYAERPRVGAAGGIATPASAAAAFAMGAAYVMTGSVNQACRESGTSDIVRQMLAQCASTDVAMAPAADMFEMGVKVQVLSKGTLFPVRAQKLYELYRAHESLEALPAAVRKELEEKFLRCSFEEAWAGCEAFFRERDPKQLERAAKEPKHRMALVFRSYLGRSSNWANDGVADRRLDFQIWCGPAMGAFNDWVKGSLFEGWEGRRVVPVAKNLMAGAAFLTRVAALRAQGVELPAELERFEARSEEEIERITTAVADVDEEADPASAHPEPFGKLRTGSASERAATNAESRGQLGSLDHQLPGHLQSGPSTPPSSFHSDGYARGERDGTSHSKISPHDEPIAIVGMGCLFPKAENVQAFWRLLRQGLDAVGDIPATHWSTGDYYDADPHAPDRTYAKRGAFLSPYAFDPTAFGIPPAILEATDTSQLLGLVAARIALEDAGYGEGVAWDKSRASVLLGVTGTQELVISLGARLGHPHWRRALKDAGVDEATAADVVERIGRSYVGWQENSFPGLLGNVVAGRIANRFDFGGTNCVIDAACASSLGAVHLGVLELRAGKSDLVLTGGVDTLNDIFMHMCFSKTPALSPTGDAKPFSDKADGTILGEGLGMLVLKRLSDAERDGDRIRAVIRSIGTSSDGRAKSIYAPLPKGQSRALREAYAEAGVTPRDIGLLEAHGTGTKAGDAAELEALHGVYREASGDRQWCAIGSVKSQIGHTKAAAGAAGLMKAALALEHKVLPPTIKVDAPTKELASGESPFYVSTEARPWLAKKQPRRAAISSFGFGGSNFHAVLEEHSPLRRTPAWDGSVELAAFSGDSAQAVLSALDAFAKSDRPLASKARDSRVAFRASQARRLLLVLESGADVQSVVNKAREQLAKSPDAAFSLVDGVHYGVGPAAGKLAFLFPGQGAQHVGMLRELACVFPEVLASLEDAGDIAAAIYPPPTFDAAEKKRREEHLTRTDNAQPAIGAVSRGALDLLSRFGVKPQLVAGHSYGELVALHAAGTLSREGLDEVSRLRGRLMAGDGGDRGTMLAVLAPLADVEKLLSEEKLDVVLANRNAPSQGVLSGSRDAIATAEERCKARGLRTSRIPVGAAFHSALVAPAAKAFGEGLEKVQFAPAKLPVIANTTAAQYPADASEARALLANQLARPVKFLESVERLYADGARTFVEVGPKAILTGLTKSILGDRPHTAVALDAQGKRGGLFDLATALARIAAAGHSVQLEEWQRVPLPPRTKVIDEKAPRMSVPLTGANHRAPQKPLPPRAVKPASNGVHLNGHANGAQTNGALANGAVHVTKNGVSAKPHTNGASHPQQEPVVAAPVAAPASSALLEALRANQESVRALQALQEQTARVHQSFLEAQLQAQQSFQALLTGQQQLMQQAISGAPVVAALPQAPVFANGHHAAPAAAEPLKTNGSAHVFEAPVIPAKAIPAPAPAPAVAPVVAPAAAPTVDIVPTLLAVVSEATGYPQEMLALDMDMEADLGIDSIKRVEILSLLSKRTPNAPSVNPEHLGRLRTLRQVAEFVAPVSTTDARHAGGAASAPGSSSTSSAATASTTDVKPVLLAVVAELTGYPQEMLTLDMDLEADLGIDSIKRVEILSVLSKRLPDAPSVNPEKLGALRTLRQVAEFVAPVATTSTRHAGEAASAPVAPSTSSAATTSPSDAQPVLLAVVSELTGYPQEMLTLDMDLEADLGIDSIKRVEILSVLSKRLPNAPSVDPEKLGGLRTLRQVLGFISPGANAPVAEKVAAAPAPIVAAVPTASVEVRSVIPLRIADAPVAPRLPIAADSLVAVLDESGELGAALVTRLQALGHRAEVINAGASVDAAALIVVADSHAGGGASVPGYFGVVRSLSTKLRDHAAKGGALFATVSRLDGAFGQLGTGDASAAIHGLSKTALREWPQVRCRALDVSRRLGVHEAAELIVAELRREGPMEIGLGPAGRIALGFEPVASTSAELNVREGDLVVVTGGARGVTAECAVALAEAARPAMLLLGRSPLPSEEPVWLRGAADEAAIKRVLLEQAANGPRPTPRELGDKARAVLAAREIRQTLQRLEAAGAKVLYRAVDVRDSAALSAVLDEARKSFGPVRAIVHGAGVLRDRRIEDKTDDDFRQVFDTKVTGLEALLQATRQDELRAIALFSSVSGRFGRRGQADYAMANSALVGIAQREAARRPACTVVALDWGPWAGGMVTPALKAEFEREKISLIPLEGGAQAFVEALRAKPGAPVERVIGAGFDEAPAPKGLRTVLAHRLDVETHRYLADHQLAGKPVLPVAMMVEWFAEAGQRLAGDRALVAVEEFRLLKGVTLGGAFEDVAVVLTGTRGDAVSLELRGANDVVHARANVRFGQVKAASPSVNPGELTAFTKPPYADGRLFHGALLQNLEKVAMGDRGLELTMRTAPRPAEWISGAATQRFATDPLVVDGIFQALILWCREKQGAPSLPSRLEALRLFGAWPTGSVTVRIAVRESGNGSALSDAEILDAKGELVARLEGYSCTVSASLDRAFAGEPARTAEHRPVVGAART